MPSFKSILLASVMALAASTNAHMILLTPPPYGNPDSSPLDAQGGNFPCKSTSNSGGTVTNMAIGQQQQLSFKGSAVHGGGSCQVSLTTDNPATKNSKWMVIHSIVGGCPARNSSGNNGDDPNQPDSDKYDFAIPQGVAPGAYTLAWTWFNKIGNREMYMNCASIKVTGGTSKREVAANETDEYSIPELSERATPDFPTMFIANIPTTDCTTTEGGSVQFPNPGTSVENNAGPFDPPVGPKCQTAGAQAATNSSSTSGSDSSAAASGSSSSPGSASAASPAAAAPSAAAGAPDSQANAGGTSSTPSSAAVPVVAASAAASSPAASAAASPTAVANGSAPAASAAVPSVAAVAPASGSSTGTCSQPGQSICSPDSKQIGTCTSSNTVTWIPVAAGTKCSGGLMVMANSKRSAKFRFF